MWLTKSHKGPSFREKHDWGCQLSSAYLIVFPVYMCLISCFSNASFLLDCIIHSRENGAFAGGLRIDTVIENISDAEMNMSHDLEIFRRPYRALRLLSINFLNLEIFSSVTSSHVCICEVVVSATVKLRFFAVGSSCIGVVFTSLGGCLYSHESLIIPARVPLTHLLVLLSFSVPSARLRNLKWEPWWKLEESHCHTKY